MKYHLVLPCFSIIYSLLFINSASSLNVVQRGDDKPDVVTIKDKRFVIQCNFSEPVERVEWFVNETSLEENNKLKNHYKITNISNATYTFSVSKAADDLIGNYTCKGYKGTEEADFTTHVVTPNRVRVDDEDVNVVEGEKLKIICKTAGHPPPKLRWIYKNETFNYTSVDLLDNIHLSEDNSTLEKDDIQMWDRGEFTCIGRSENGKEMRSSCYVRVKDRYAALWPFLGICAEVFVLCLIIFIYEKKRNKTELEESDTDQSPDQKNTPDHGKDSNLRHRQ